MELQDYYQKAINFAGDRHTDQKVTGTDRSYLIHLTTVAMEVLVASEHSPGFDRQFAMQIALLHDVLEDTSTNFDEIKDEFGLNIAQGVLALSKNKELSTSEQIPDSLARIKLEPKEVWAVKLADRISNMQKPPKHWELQKIINYKKMAGIILLQLKGGNPYLENRLHLKIMEYNQFIPSE